MSCPAQNADIRLPVPTWTCPNCGFVHHAADIVRLGNSNTDPSAERAGSSSIGFGLEDGPHDEVSPRDFLRNSTFSPERANERFPNARSISLRGLFVSHSGKDSARIREQVINPVISDRFPDTCFMHTRLSGGAEPYRLLVQAALHWCDKFMVFISERSVTNPWVVAEVEWALEILGPS